MWRKGDRGWGEEGVLIEKSYGKWEIGIPRTNIHLLSTHKTEGKKQETKVVKLKKDFRILSGSE